MKQDKDEAMCVSRMKHWGSQGWKAVAKKFDSTAVAGAMRRVRAALGQRFWGGDKAKMKQRVCQE